MQSFRALLWAILLVSVIFMTFTNVFGFPTQIIYPTQFTHLGQPPKILDDPVHITIHRLAEKLGLSVRQVQRLMKSHYGITFRQMQMDTKLELACRLLEDTRDSVEKIAEAAGFSTADYFGYCFKKKYEISPGKFRKRTGGETQDQLE